MKSAVAYDCQQCGACCTNQESIPAVGYVCLTRDESKQMKRLGLTVVHADGSFYLGTRMRAGIAHAACVALEGQTTSSCRCAIYDHRPRNCRRFEVGSALCAAARLEA